MKMMKKLMAVALAGVMALTLLAGCGNPYALTEKELLNALTDLSPITLGSNKVTLKAADNTDAAAVMQALDGKDLENRDFYLETAADWQARRTDEWENSRYHIRSGSVMATADIMRRR